MRQVGLLAAAADYALEHHWKLLEEDHRRARELAMVIDTRSDMSIDMDAVQSNIVIFELKTKTAAEFLELAKAAGILLVPFGPHKVRVVYHFQISQEKHEQVIEFFTSL
jgi:threonine aldolase